MFRALFTSSHFFKMLGYFMVAAALMLLVGYTMSAGSLLTGLISAVVIGGVGMSFGLAATILLRQWFSLMQTGRWIQYACFLVGTWLGVGLTSWLVDSFATGSSFFAALSVFVLAFGVATLTGEVPTKGRTWMPVRMPKR